MSSNINDGLSIVARLATNVSSMSPNPERPTILEHLVEFSDRQREAERRPNRNVAVEPTENASARKDAAGHNTDHSTCSSTTSHKKLAINGAKVCELRLRKGWTQQDLADATPRDNPTSLSTVKRAEKSPGNGKLFEPGTFRSLADALGVTVAELIAD